MESAPEITIQALLLCYALLLIPAAIAWRFKIPLVKNLVISTIRMSGQLFFAGIVLILLFKWDNPWLNILWVLLMIIFAALSAVQNSQLRWRLFLPPIFLSSLIGCGFLLLLFSGIIVHAPGLFDARVFVVVGGMLLGNALRGIVIGISHFYQNLYLMEKRYLYRLALGASVFEALLPFYREGLLLALKPYLASMATMGLVFLPGMMTGQILGGASPDNAIKYQIAIMIVIFIAVTLSVTFSIWLTARKSIDAYGVLKREIFEKIPG